MNLFRNDILEIIFEKKNKLYGAYDLRIKYPKVLTRSGLSSMLAFMLLMTSPMIAKYFKEEAEKEEAEVKKKTKVKLMTPPPQDQTKPPPPVIPPPPKLQMQQFTPPKVVKDEEVDEKHAMKEQDKLTDPISTKDQEGEKNVVIPTNIEVEKGPVEDNEIRDQNQVEFQAKFKKNLNDYLANEIEYPDYEKSAGIDGTVKVEFVVEKNGSLSNIHVVGKVSQGLDDEAIRVLNKISGPGNWTPATYGGAPVRMRYILPINYTLSE